MYDNKAALCRTRSFAGLILGVTLALLSACADNSALRDLQQSGVLDGLGGGTLSTDEITRGLKEALSTGSAAVVQQLGRADGFNGDAQIRIPLPNALSKARDIASRVGLANSFDELELRLNRAAEAAAPKAGSLFLDAIKSMTVDDARSILKGADDAATRYFESRTREPLAALMRPVVDRSLSEVGAVNYFNQLKTSYERIPLAPPLDADLTGHVVERAMNGIFLYLAREEVAIRKDPLKRTTALLRKVFSAQ